MDREKILNLLSTDKKLKDIADELGTSYTNLRYWIKKHKIDFSRKSGPKKLSEEEQERLNSHIYENALRMVEENRVDYNYLFGLYLGDGWTSLNKGNFYSFGIIQDSKYPNLIKSIYDSMERFMQKKPSICNKEGAKIVKTGSREVKYLFPKYGTGMKYLNRVYLPKMLIDNLDHRYLLAGLFYSDGSYYYDKFNKKMFFTFSNRSKEIIEIYKNCLDNLGIKYDSSSKISGQMHVNIRRKSEVEKMFNMVGDKNNPIL